MGIASRMLRSDGPDAERGKNHRSTSDRSISSAGGIFRGSKRTCANRAQWRLVRGQAAKRLSEHYLLECDFGMSILTIYNEGDPVFLCEGHVSAITPRDSAIAGVRPVEAKDELSHEVIAAAKAEPLQLTLIPAAPVSAQADALSLSTANEAANLAEAPAQSKIEEAPTDPVQAPAVVAPSGGLGSAPASGPVVDISELSQPEQSARNAPPESIAAPKPPALKNSLAGRGAAMSLKREPASVSRTPARDLTYGNAAKALVDETIWNMATGDIDAYRAALTQGKTEMEAAQLAGGQIAVVHRKIADYSSKIEPMLSASSASISVGFAIDKPLEQATLEIIAADSMSEAEKDAAVARLGALQEQIKGGLHGNIAPLEAHRIAREIAVRCNWGADSALPDELKNACRAVYTRLRDALRAFVPEARELDERLANLYAAKAELETASPAKSSRSAAV